MSVRRSDGVDRSDDLGAGMQLDEALERVFAPHRVDAAAFERAVAARVAAREPARPAAGPPTVSGGKPDDAPPAHAAFWRRVAALLPIDPGSGGVASGAAAAKVFGGKVLPAALLLPLLVLAAAFSAFFAALRRIKAGPRAGWPEEQVRGRRTVRAFTGPVKPWWAEVTGVFAISLIVTPWSAWAADAWTFWLALSTLALAYSVRNLTETGVSGRIMVASTVSDYLTVTLTVCALAANRLPLREASSEFGLVIATAALLAAKTRAGIIAMGSRAALAGFTMFAAFLYVLNPIGLTFSIPLLLRPKLAAMSLDPEEPTKWQEAAAVHRALVAVGSPAPEPGGARARLAEVLARGRARDVQPVVWTAALDFGWFGEAEWRALAAQLPHLDPSTVSGDIRPVPLIESQRYELALTLAGAEVSPAWREVQVAHLERSWPSTGQDGALVTASEVVRRLELLGRADLVGPFRERAHALLRDHWVSLRSVERNGTAGGFTANPRESRTSLVDATLAAVELMGRFGVPDGFDVAALRSYLRYESRAQFLFAPESRTYVRAEARAALLRLDRELELPPVSLFERVLSERFTIAALLFAAMGFIAMRSPRQLGPGAPL